MKFFESNETHTKERKREASFESLHLLLSEEDMSVDTRIVFAELKLLKKTLATLPLHIEEPSSSS